MMLSNGKKRRPLGVKWKLFAYLSAFVALTLVLLWFFQVVFLQDFYKAIKINKVKVAGDIAARAVSDGSVTEEEMRNLGWRSDTNIIVIDMQGNALLDLASVPGGNTSSMPREELAEFARLAQEAGGTYLKSFDRNDFARQKSSEVPPDKAMKAAETPPFRGIFRFDHMEGILYVKTAQAPDGTQYAVILNAMITPVDATVETIQIQLIVVTGIMLVFALALAFFISRRIARPIVTINESSKRLAKGDYSVHFQTNGYKEIAELSETLNRATYELSRVDALRKELIANVSHDLRTPLTMITGYAEVIRDLPGEDTAENVQVIIDESKRLTTLVNDMLDLSKLEAGVMELNRTRFDFTRSVHSIMQRYNKLMEQEGYIIKFTCDREAEVEADESKISQVIYNLVNNAITYTGEDKLVLVRQIVRERTVRLEIQDFGEGIPAEKQDDIWNRYYKLDRAHRRAQIGTGLGLSIVKSVVELHGGTCGVISKAGEGSTFWFELALAQDD